MPIRIADYIKTDSKIFQAVKEIVNKHDPMGLLELGAPDGEYTTEIVDIIHRCSYRDNVQDVQNVLKEIFDYWFYPNCVSDNVLSALANDLVQLFNKY